jgi:predicted transport protein
MKLKIKGLKKEMSTTGTGASFAPGTGAQYASPKAFKIKQTEAKTNSPITQLISHFDEMSSKLASVNKQKYQNVISLISDIIFELVSMDNKSEKQSLLPTNEVGEPFTEPNPSIPNRPSKFIDYKQIFEKIFKELSSSQVNIGVNSGIDMNSLDATDVLEIKVGDTKVEKGIKYTVADIDSETGKISWKVDYVPAFDSVYKEFDDLRKIIAQLDQKTDDEVVDDIASKIQTEFNRYRTHIRKNYPDAYKKFKMNEELNVSRNTLKKIYNEMGAAAFGNMIIDIEDENVLDYIVDELRRQYPIRINEARYSEFKQETKLRTPTEQIHRAVREIRRKIDEIVKVVNHTERMKNELKQSNEGMAYLKRTRNAISSISEKLQELNNRIKGLTE